MLDLQRQRYAPRHHADIGFSRVILVLHLVLGSLTAVLMMFHEIFFVSLLVTLWYLMTLGLIAGLRRHQQWCRISLGICFFIGSALGLFFLMWEAPALNPEDTPLLSRKLLPFWLSTVAFAYAAGGMVMIISQRLKRATMQGFTLWDPQTY